MYEFKYKAINNNRKIIQGKYLAENEDELILSLRDRGYFLLECKNNSRNILLKKANKKEILILCEELSILLTTGINIAEALNVLEKQNFNRVMKECIEEIKLEVIKGKQLYISLMKFDNVFPLFMIKMVKIGEETGNLDKVIKYLAQYYSKEFTLENELKNLITYPAIVFFTTIIIVILLTMNVVPIFVNISIQSGIPVPSVTRKLVYIVNWLKTNKIIIFVVIGLLSFIFSYYIQVRKKALLIINNLLFKIPSIENIHSKILVGTFSRTMKMLLESGINIVDSLNIMSCVMENKKTQEEIMLCIKDVKNGISTMEALKNLSIFSAMHISMLEVGEGCGKLDEIFGRIACYVEKEVEWKIKRLLKYIEPAITILLSVFIGLVIKILISPLFNIIDSIGI